MVHSYIYIYSVIWKISISVQKKMYLSLCMKKCFPYMKQFYEKNFNLVKIMYTVYETPKNAFPSQFHCRFFFFFCREIFPNHCLFSRIIIENSFSDECSVVQNPVCLVLVELLRFSTVGPYSCTRDYAYGMRKWWSF